MSRKLLPIGESESGEWIVGAISSRIASLVAKGEMADVWITPAAIDIVAAIERYKNGEISEREAIKRIKGE